MGKPKWKALLEEKIEKANKMAEEFREMGLNCTVNEAGEICFTGKDVQEYNEKRKI